MTNFIRKVNLAIVILHYDRLVLNEIDKLLREKWGGILKEDPEEAYGNLTYLFHDDLGTTSAVVNEGFVELRTNKEDPLEVLSELAGDVLEAGAQESLGVSMELTTVLEIDEPVEICGTLMHPLRDLLEDFTRETGAEVQAVSPRLYIRHGGTMSGLYTFDITPYVYDPQRSIFCRLKSRRADGVNRDKVRKAIAKDLALFAKLVESGPRVFLRKLEARSAS